MRKLIITLIVSSAFMAVARADNATAGASVTLNGTFFTEEGGWSLGTNAAPNDLVNGVYQPASHQWNFDSVWWNGFSNPANNIVIALTGAFLITDLKIQADNNDVYGVEYYGADSVWHNAWSVPAPGGWGLQTSSTGVAPFVTDRFRLTGSEGDWLYSISQFEATGQKLGRGGSDVPEGGLTVALLGAALGLLGIARRFIRG
jgi:hypothetical protein